MTTRPYLSDDLNELHAAQDAYTALRDAAEAAMLAADTGSDADIPAYERACKAFDEADDVLVLIGRKLFEIEEDCAYEAQRRERADYWRGVL